MYENDQDIAREGLQEVIDDRDAPAPQLFVIVRIPLQPACPAAPCRESHDPKDRHYDEDCPATGPA
jgi:hypothetical protein